MAIINDATQVKSLTDQITELLVYMADLEKGYTDNRVSTEVEKFTKDLGATKDELKALVTALDGLDFKEDGKIDPKVITAKVAQTEALVNVNKEALEGVKTQLTDIVGKVSGLSEKQTGDIKAVQSKLSEVIDSVNKISSMVEAGNFGTSKETEDKIEDLKKQVTSLTAQVSKHDDELGKMKLDIDAIKAQLKPKFF